MRGSMTAVPGLGWVVWRLGLLGLLAGAGVARPQVVGVIWGYSGFAVSQKAGIIVAYSQTEMNEGAMDMGYCPYASGELFDGTQWGWNRVAWGVSPPNAYFCWNAVPGYNGGWMVEWSAEFQVQNPGDTYLVHSVHYADALDTGCNAYNGDDCTALNDPLFFYYWYPLSYGWFYPSGHWWSGAMDGTEPQGSVPGVQMEYIAIGMTYAELDTGTPTITSVEPRGIPIGNAGIITIGGTNLIDPLDQSVHPLLNVGAPLTIVQGSASQVKLQLNSTIPFNQPRGSTPLTLSHRFGTSAQWPFWVGDPTPAIRFVTPAAGPPATFTVTGTGFGSNPRLTLDGPDLQARPTALTPGANDNGTVATTNPAQAPIIGCPMGQPVSFTLLSNGFDGTHFVGVPSDDPRYPPTSPTATAVATLTAPAPAPAPQILFQGSNIANNNTAPEPLVVGQLVSLLASAPTSLPGNCGLANQSWALSGGPDGQGGTTVGGWSVTVDPGTQLQTAGGPKQMPAKTDSSYEFYWVDSDPAPLPPGYQRRQVTYKYTMSNGQWNQATAVFQVSGPTNPGLSVAQQGWADVVSINGSPALGLFGVPAPPQVGNGGTVGVRFQAGLPGLNWPSGSYSWVQLLSKDEKQVLRNGGVADLSRFVPVVPGKPHVLDDHYQYPSHQVNVAADLVVDSPAIEPCPGWGETEYSLTATMYLLWTPVLNTRYLGCTKGDACTIPVPLGNISWWWAGDAVNTLIQQPNATTWLLGCGDPRQDAPHQGGFVPSNAYPSWDFVEPSGVHITCP